MQPLTSKRNVLHEWQMRDSPTFAPAPSPADRAERIAYLEWLAERYPEDDEGFSRLDEREPPVSFEEWRARCAS